MVTAAAPAAVLRDLGAARRRNRLLGIHWADAIYRVYILAVGVGGLVWWIATMFGNRRIGASGYPSFERRAAEVAGLLLAAVVLLAIRSGRRGGPLAIDSAELTHVLMSPIDRRRALGRSVVQQYRRGLYLGSVSGAVAGRLMVPFVLGNRLVWTIAGAVVGAFAGLLWMALAMNVSGRRLAAPLQLVGVALVAWSVVDLRMDRITSPLSWLGGAVLFPLHDVTVSGVTTASSGARLAALASLAVLLALAGLAGCAGLRIEQAERRAALVSQLRFAVTTQDLRSVLLLRRQLGAEHLRSVPRFRVNGRPGPERAVIVRSLRSVARWPTTRLVRIVALAVVSGVAARLAYEATAPLVIVPGLLAFVAGLDAIEPLSQDADHPGLLASFPRHRGRLANRQAVVPSIVLGVLGQAGAVAAWLAGPLAGAGMSPAVLALGAILAFAWGAAGAIAGAISVAIGPPSLALMLQTPELAFARSLASPGVSTLAVAMPVLIAHAADHKSQPAAPAFIRGLMVTVFVIYFGITFLTSGGIRDQSA